MFRDGRSFDQSIDAWNVSSVTTMADMFKSTNGIHAFNQSLNSWDVTSVTDMSDMFFGNNSFNGNISSWVPKFRIWNQCLKERLLLMYQLIHGIQVL